MSRAKPADFEGWVQRLRQGLQEALGTGRQFATSTRDDLGSINQEVREYLASESFERDLDQLAARLEIDETAYSATEKTEDRSARVRSKAHVIFKQARSEVFSAAELGGGFAVISRRPRVVLAIALVCGGIRSASIAYDIFQVFSPAVRRRRGLRVV